MQLEESKINSGIRQSRLSGTFFRSQGDGADKSWLANISENLLEQVNSAGRDIKAYFASVAGGAKVVLEKIGKGDWGFFKKWFDEAPLLPKLAGTGAALLSGAVVLFVGSAVIGGIVGGVKATIASLGVGNSLILGTMMPGIMTSVISVTEWAYNFDWAAPDTAIIQQCKDAINRIYEPLGDSLGRAFAAVLAGRFGKRFPAPEVDIDMSIFACYAIINPTLENEIVDALTDLLTAIKSIAYEILFIQSYRGIRQIAAKLTGNNDWGQDGQEPFVISKKVETFYQKVKASEYLGHITEEQWEGIESFWESFTDTLKDLLQDEDTYANWGRRRPT